MAREAKKLSDRKVQSSSLAPGRYSDGEGLYLVVGDGGSKRWMFHFRDGGTSRREMGLGNLSSVSLKDARQLAAEARRQVAAGVDPIQKRRDDDAARAGAGITFGQFIDHWLPTQLAKSRNDKHQYQWRATLEGYGGALRGKRPADIGIDDVLAVLQQVVTIKVRVDGKLVEKRGQLWLLMPETASRLRGRIERVLAATTVAKLRSGPNPAEWRGNLEHRLPAHNKLSRKHYAAMPYADVPAFMGRLREAPGMGALALQFTILTAARSGEAIGARWREIDLEQALWTVPPERMKAGEEHRVPLGAVAVALLRQLHETRRSEHVFPGIRSGAPISNMTMLKALRTLTGDNLTVHGFRSSFRDFCGEETSFPREVAEAALAHKVGDQVELAYRRGDALAKRRKLMAAWEKFLSASTMNDVVPIRGAGTIG